MLRTRLIHGSAGLALLLLLGAAGILGAWRAGGWSAAVLAVVATSCALVLLLRTRGAAAETASAAAVFDAVLLALPGALVVYLSFNSGGYFPDTPAVAAILLVILLVLRVTLLPEPFAAFSAPLAIAAGALGLLSAWILLSALWSDAPGRALIEFDRAFLYLLVLVICGSVARTATRLRWMAAALALGIVVVAIAALATRLAPDHFPTSIPAIGESNLAYPLTYSNALGILCVLGAILCLYFATSVNQARSVRALGCAALPILATTVYLTLSRGPVAAAIIGVVAFVLIGRPRGLATGLLAAVPASVVAVASAYQHPVLTSANSQTASAASQGHRVALVLSLCVAAGAILRLLLTPLDDRLRAFSLPDDTRRPVLAGGWVALLVVVLAVAVAVDAPSKVSDQYHRFVNTGQASPTQDVRQSVFSSANRGIVDNWSVALDAFRASPLHGQGAGDYENYWNQHRPAHQASYNVVNAHSLYAQTLGDLGVVGFALLLALLVSILVALLPFRRGPNRSLYAALFATALAFVAHAGVDWDWEMPAVTVGVFALGGAALAAHVRTMEASPATQAGRVTVGVLLLAGLVTPALIFVSQRQLNDARDALREGHCARAIDRATASIETISLRPEPYEVLALCQQQRGRTGFAVQAMRKAVDKDPDNWRYHFELGVLLGGARLDARPELVTAHRLNPLEHDTSELLKAVPAGSAVNWELELRGPSGATVNQP